MKKIFFSSIIPFRGYLAINLFGFIFVRKELKPFMTGYLARTTINHESIHSEQYKELLFVLFLILYVTEFLLKFIYVWFTRDRYKLGPRKSNWDIAYRSISLEQEAYKYEDDYEYLKTRKRYNWLKYIFKLYSE